MRTSLFAAGAAALVAGSASASITGATVVSYSVTAADFGGASVTVNVQDMYMTSDDAADVMLNVYNLTLSGTASGITYFQSFTGTGWQPTNLGGPFDNAALQQADSLKQCRLARAGRAEQRHDLARHDIEIDTAQHVDAFAALLEAAGQAAKFDHGAQVSVTHSAIPVPDRCSPP